MSILNTLYEFLFVRPELVRTRRLENPDYLLSVKSTFATQEEYAEWLRKQSFRLEADFQIASTIGIHSRVERISKAQQILKNEIDLLHDSSGAPKHA